MEGPVAGVYAQAQIRKCTKSNTWPTMAELREEVDKFFSPQSEVDYARNRIKDLRQGGARIDEFMNKFTALKQIGKVSDDYAYALLKRAIKPEIMKESLLHQEKPPQHYITLYHFWILYITIDALNQQKVQKLSIGKSPY